MPRQPLGQIPKKGIVGSTPELGGASSTRRQTSTSLVPPGAILRRLQKGGIGRKSQWGNQQNKAVPY